jgi:hypothetical protein
MNTKSFLRKLAGFALAALLLPGMLLLPSSTAQAQWRRVRRPVIVVRPVRPFRYGYGWRGYNPYGYPYGYYGQYVFSNGETAFNQGYHDGLKTGSDDGRKHKSYDPERSHYFHDAGFGNFAEAYRQGFARGYRMGYSG